MSHTFGYYPRTLFEFSDSTLNYLLNELTLWSSELKDKSNIQNYKMTLTQDCLN